jgi:PAS domain S-box-containing protein
MHGILLPCLYILCGISLYAALHHGLFALRRPVERVHLLFAMLCLTVAIFIFCRAWAYQSTSSLELVNARRWEVYSACAIFTALIWFVTRATGLRLNWLLTSLTIFWILVFILNMLLPYGIIYLEQPQLNYFSLPWGEIVPDLRALHPTRWFQIVQGGLILIIGYCTYACVLQYRLGLKNRALLLASGLIIFFGFLLFNIAVHQGLIKFILLAEFGYVGLIMIMSLGLTRSLRDHERRMNAVLNHLPAMVHMKDLQGRYVLVNQAFESLFKITNTHATGKTDFDLFPRELAEKFRANDLTVLTERKASEFEEVMKINGQPHTFLSLKFPLLSQDGLPYALCTISNDLTEYRHKDEEMRLLRKKIWHADRVTSTGTITASLAHEISQPLAAILSNAQAGLRFLNLENPNLNELQELLQDIARDGKRAGSIINGLRNMLKQRETQKDRIDLSECIKEVLELLHSELIMRGANVETDFASGCLLIADKAQIQQVILNLMINALEASEDLAQSPYLKISVACESANQVHVSVRDKGIGIPTEMIDKVFDGFFTTKAKGLGVGLAVCRSIVESHGGNIWVENNADRGVTFHITIPVDKSIKSPSPSAKKRRTGIQALAPSSGVKNEE